MVFITNLSFLISVSSSTPSFHPSLFIIAFLQGLFDSEMSNFQTSTNKTHENNILQLRMEMCKCEKLISNLYSYFQQIKKLLNYFDIESSIKGPKFVRIDKSGENIFKYSLLIKNNLRNIYNFINKVGFCFSLYKKNRRKF